MEKEEKSVFASCLLYVVKRNGKNSYFEKFASNRYGFYTFLQFSKEINYAEKSYLVREHVSGS